MTSPRLDILLYAHDGRGLGHVSRSAAIGMALRRLYPELRVCLLTGCRQTQDLISPAPLEWLKLPAYETEVVDGTSCGIDGLSNYSDRELASIREKQIQHIFSLYRPRVFLADHTPQGKHRELVPALTSPASSAQTTCVLGVRGVVGGVSQTKLPLARDLFSRYFSKLLWYGDSTILGHEHRDILGRRFMTDAFECGYVSRLAELNLLYPHLLVEDREFACTISIPWLGEYTERFLTHLADAIQRVGPGFGSFRIYLGQDASEVSLNRLNSLEECTVESFGSSYANSLCSSKSAMIFGGYNSLVDVLAVKVAALVVLRDMRDKEQQEHLEALTKAEGERLSVIDEKGCSSESIYQNLLSLLGDDVPAERTCTINLDGAENAAHALAALL